MPRSEPPFNPMYWLTEEERQLIVTVADECFKKFFKERHFNASHRLIMQEAFRAGVGAMVLLMGANPQLAFSAFTQHLMTFHSPHAKPPTKMKSRRPPRRK